MFHLLPRLVEEFPWLHQRSPTEDDLLSFCQKKSVEVIFRPDVPYGVYVMTGGEHYIFLNTALRGWMLLYVFCHEIAHYLFHSPSQSNLPTPDLPPTKRFAIEFFNREKKRKNHIEAEQVASLMLLPINELEEVLISGAYEVYPELAELVATRLSCEKLLKEAQL